MNAKVIVGILVLAALGGAYWYYNGNLMQQTGETITQDTIAPGHSDDPGSTKQDAMLIVGESIVGKWVSKDDAKFMREFTANAAIDSYEGKQTSSAPWRLFTKEKPISVSFVLDADTVYLQIQDEQPLNFKIVKLTPEELEMVYMDRGNTLRFSRIGQ